MIEWTKESIATRSDKEVRSLCENAAKHGRQDIVDLCNDELGRRKPVRERRPSKNSHDNHVGHYVSEFHFVCPSEWGVTRNSDGTIWTGTWVVADNHAEAAIDFGSHVALHSSRAEPSYLQGIIKSWRKSARQARYTGDQLVQTKDGIDFQFAPSDKPLLWRGDATGEKGYGWAPIPE